MAKSARTATRPLTAKVYIMAGNAIETPRLLLMSKNERTPDGVANVGQRPLRRQIPDGPSVTLSLGSRATTRLGYRGPLSTAGIEDLRDGPFRRERGAFRIEIGNEGWNFSRSGEIPDARRLILLMV